MNDFIVEKSGCKYMIFFKDKEINRIFYTSTKKKYFYFCAKIAKSEMDDGPAERIQINSPLN